MKKRALPEGATDLFSTKLLPKHLFLAILVAAFFYLPVQAVEFRDCPECHGEKLTEEQRRNYLHSPFAQEKCGECHDADNFVQSSDDGAVAATEDQMAVEWLATSSVPANRHWFLLEDLKAQGTLTIEVRGEEGFYKKKVDVPPVRDLPPVEDAGRPPMISNVEVEKVQRDVFLKARIGWKTDTLTTAEVRYGISGLTQESDPDDRFGRHHSVVLYDLQPDRTYSFSVVSTDLFGREQVSEPRTFSTARPFATTETGLTADMTAKIAGEEIESRFQSVGTDHLLELHSEQPSSVYVGIESGDRSEFDAEIQAENEDPHVGLSSREEASLVACRSCHKRQTSITHPVGVKPGPEMSIPPEYPTLSDGRISCRTCHETHGSDYDDLTIKRGKRELCVGCHRDMI